VVAVTRTTDEDFINSIFDGEDPGPAEPPDDDDWRDARQDAPPPGAAPDDEAVEVEREVRKLRIREAARLAFAAEQAGDTEPPTSASLSAFLAVPDEPVRYRVDGLLPVGGRVIVAAQFKAGKSVLNHNLVGSLADGAPFLGRFPVRPPTGRIVLFDLELDERTLRRWLRDQGIESADRVEVVPLRGKVASFAILDPTNRAEWAKRLRDWQAGFVIFDCLRPALDAFGLDESRDAGRWLTAFDALLDAAGVAEAVVTHRMGHAGERARGDSRLRDWPDAEWRLVREQPDDPREQPDRRAPRYLSAYGRDVAVPEGALSYDEATRRLTFAGGNRKEAAADLPVDLVVAIITEAPGLNANSLEHRLR
jgi:AAA domain